LSAKSSGANGEKARRTTFANHEEYFAAFKE
jgi:hypothetical protein